MKIIYNIVLAATTLTPSSSIASENVGIYEYDIRSSVNYVASQESTTSNQIVDDSRYLNTIKIKNSFHKRLREKNIQDSYSGIVEKLFDSLCEKCSSFDIKEVYADYSLISKAIRIDMIIDDDFLLIVRKTIDEEDDNCVAVSLSKDGKDYLIDYFDIINITREVNYFIKKRHV